MLTRRSARPAAGAALALAASLALAGCGGGSEPGDIGAQATTPLPTVITPSGAPSPSTTPNPGGLTDEQMVGQLFMTYVYGASATDATPAQRQANNALYGEPTAADVVRRWHLGGVILVDHNNLDPARTNLSTGNVGSAAQIRDLTAGLQAAATDDSGIPLLIATDQEGGRVQRITDGVTRRPAQQQIANETPTQLCRGYLTLGQQLRDLGVNQDLAPDADVVRTATGAIGDRSFGPDPQLDARDVQAAVTGLQAAGVLATLKHWPGHGSTSTDSHAALAVVTESAQVWQQVDRVPFAASAAAAAAVMVGHLALPAVDPSGAPATLSPVLVEGELRQGLGFQGLVISDSMWMEPMRAAGDPGAVALRALAAGVDMILETPDLPDAYQTVLDAVRADPAVRAQVTSAVTRILAAKARTTATPTGACPDSGIG